MSSVAKSANSGLKDETSAREKILDAAEKLFAVKGFNGATTREIASEATVPLGLMAYYFKTKNDLYSEVIKRRSEEHAAFILHSVNAVVENAGDHPVSVSALVRAFFEPIVVRALHSGPGWKSYIHLLAQAANTRRKEPYVSAFEQVYSPVQDQFIGFLKDRFPDARDEDIYWSFYFLTSSIIHILVESESVDRFSGGKCKSTDLKTIMDKMGPFFEAGISRLAER